MPPHSPPPEILDPLLPLCHAMEFSLNSCYQIFGYNYRLQLRQSNVFTRVCDSVHREGLQHPLLSIQPPGLTPLPGQTPPAPRDGHCSGRYASYWNAVLFSHVIATNSSIVYSMVFDQGSNIPLERIAYWSARGCFQHLAVADPAAG